MNIDKYDYQILFSEKVMKLNRCRNSNYTLSELGGLWTLRDEVKHNRRHPLGRLGVKELTAGEMNDYLNGLLSHNMKKAGNKAPKRLNVAGHYFAKCYLPSNKKDENPCKYCNWKLQAFCDKSKPYCKGEQNMFYVDLDELIQEN